MTVAYDIARGEPRFFRSSGPDGALLMRDVARAACSPPGFFPPAVVPTGPDGTPETLVDGALFANNPAMLAYAELRSRGVPDRDILLVSLSAGRRPYLMPSPQMARRGFLYWGPNIVRIAFDGAARTADLLLRSLLPPNGDGSGFFRIEAEIPAELEAIDDARPQQVVRLKDFAEQLVAANSEVLEHLCERLLTRPPRPA